MSDIIDLNEVDLEIARVIEQMCNLPVGFHEPPQHGRPYVVIYVETLGPDETALMLDSYRDQNYRLDYVGETRDQVRAAQARVHDVLLVGKAWSYEKGICGVTVSSAGLMRREDASIWVLPENLQVKVSST